MIGTRDKWRGIRIDKRYPFGWKKPTSDGPSEGD